MLQQYLPFTVLKQFGAFLKWANILVATVLTVYGIETTTVEPHLTGQQVATVLTVYGIETRHLRQSHYIQP